MVEYLKFPTKHGCAIIKLSEIVSVATSSKSSYMTISFANGEQQTYHFDATAHLDKVVNTLWSYLTATEHMFDNQEVQL